MIKNYNNILTALKYYIPIKFWNLNNWDVIIGREKEVEKNVFEYRCSFYTLYFNEKLVPITYGNQYVVNNRVYYETKQGIMNRGDVYLGKVNWYNQRSWGR